VATHRSIQHPALQIDDGPAFGLPLAPRVRFTENEQTLKPGEGLWVTATGIGTYRLYAADPGAGEVGFFATMRENDTPLAMALRLKIENRRIGEGRHHSADARVRRQR